MFKIASVLPQKKMPKFPKIAKKGRKGPKIVKMDKVGFFLGCKTRVQNFCSMLKFFLTMQNFFWRLSDEFFKNP